MLTLLKPRASGEFKDYFLEVTLTRNIEGFKCAERKCYKVTCAFGTVTISAKGLAKI